MKKRLILILLVLIVLGGMTTVTKASVTVSFNFFYNNLAPQGRWVAVPNYGEVWQPLGVSLSWRPYSNGHWVWTDDGWMWVSYNPWGAITDHYGRWIYESNDGWVWVPGAVWAPAWVSWYVGPTYIGWAPLPPYGYIRIVPRYCLFVPFHAFLSINLYHVYVPASRNVIIIRSTIHITNITVVHNVVINRGPQINLVERRTGVMLHPVRLVSTGKLSYSGERGNRVYVFRPHVTAAPRFHTPLLKTEANRGIVRVGGRRLRLSSFHPHNTIPYSKSQRIKRSLHSTKKKARFHRKFRFFDRKEVK